jgi:hypothetical protein
MLLPYIYLFFQGKNNRARKKKKNPTQGLGAWVQEYSYAPTIHARCNALCKLARSLTESILAIYLYWLLIFRQSVKYGCAQHFSLPQVSTVLDCVCVVAVVMGFSFLLSRLCCLSLVAALVTCFALYGFSWNVASLIFLLKNVLYTSFKKMGCYCPTVCLTSKWLVWWTHKSLKNRLDMRQPGLCPCTKVDSGVN